MDIPLAYSKHCRQWQCRSTHYLKHIRYLSFNRQKNSKEARSREQRNGKLLKSLWFLPIATIKKLFRVQLGDTSNTEDVLI
jgi:hypothetical protein